MRKCARSGKKAGGSRGKPGKGDEPKGKASLLCGREDWPIGLPFHFPGRGAYVERETYNEMNQQLPKAWKFSHP